MRNYYFAVIGCIAAFGAQAQVLDEIVVTAQKREQKIEDVGMAITAFSGDQLQRLNFHGATDIAAQTPSLAYAVPFGDGNNAAFTLRGVGLNDFSEHNESPVAVYTDGVYQATLAGTNFQLFDIERVEVLRGPQGTLYGRNTTGGIVQFVSKKPSRVAKGYAEVQGGQFGLKRIEGAYGAPLSDSIAARVSILYNQHDGYRPSRTPGMPAANASDALAGRLQLAYAPSDTLDMLLNVHGGSNHTVASTYKHLATMYAADGYTEIPTPSTMDNPTCVAVAGAPTGPGNDCFGYHDTNPNLQSTENDRKPYIWLDTHGASFTLNSKVGSLDFTSITGYERVHKVYGEDTDMGPVPAIAVTNPVESKEWTQEFRLAGKADKVIWTAGLFYYDRKMDSGSRTDLSAIGLPDDDFNVQMHSKSAALFGQMEYSLTPQVTLIGGLRFSHEDQRFEMLSVDHTGLTPVFLGLSADPIPDYVVFDFRSSAVGDLTRRKDNLSTFRAEINWKPTDKMLYYASIAKGSKSAGWNAAIDGTGIIGASKPGQIPYAPEKLMAYEVGVKTQITGKVRASASAFYYDYKDFQAFTFDQLAQVISNRPAKVKGIEGELVASPTEHWDILLGFSALDSSVEGVTTSNGAVTRSRHMVLSPDFAVNGLLRYRLPVGGGRELSFQTDGRYVGKQYFDLQNNPIATEKGHAVMNASITLSGADERWNFSVWVKNLANEQYRAYAIPVTSLGFTQQMIGEPRWVGASLGYKW